MEHKKRKKIRLKTYNYSQNGCYFITICTKDREHLLCLNDTILDENAKFILSEIGTVVKIAIENIEAVYDGVDVIEYVIMPNHIHLILRLNKNADISVSGIVRQTKGLVTKKAGFPVWQKSFYDHVIRNENDYYEIVRYIQMNPLKWQNDRYYNTKIE